MCLHINLHKYKSRSKVREFIDNYNNSLPLTSTGRKQLGKFLRQQHSHLIEHLIEIFYLELKKSQVHGHTPNLGDRLPSLRTNNVQLSKRMNCCERTVRGLRARLKEAGIIEAETFHGSNSGYEIWLNPDLLYMSTKQTEQHNAVDFFARPNGIPALRQLQTLPHTVTSKNILVTNKLNKLSGAPLQPIVDNQSVTVNKPVDNYKNHVDKANETVEKSQLNTNKGTNKLQETGYRANKRKTIDTSPPLAAAPPKVAPQKLDEVLEGMEHKSQRLLEKWVQTMYRTAVITLYPDRWIAKNECERTKARLAEYLRYAPQKNWKNGAQEVMDRMVLVRKYIDRHYPDGNYNMMLPSIYFDVRNNRKSSFVKTKTWFKSHKESQREIANKVLLTKAVKEYFKSLEDGSKISPSEAYRKISQRLNKRDNNLLKQFHEKITDNGSTANAA